MNFKPIENFGTLNDIFNEVWKNWSNQLIYSQVLLYRTSMDPNSGNKDSLVKGLYQFTNDIWKIMLKQYGASMVMTNTLFNFVVHFIWLWIIKKQSMGYFRDEIRLCSQFYI